MKVIELKLRNFRNVRESVFRPDPHLNFLIGPNGQGKTSFLEALGYFATLRSFRASKTPEVIRWGETVSEISAALVPDMPDGGNTGWKTDLKIVFQASDATREKTSKVAFINGKAYKSSTTYLSQRFGNFELGFNAVVFNPADHDLVRGEPAIRRAYLDRMLAAEDVEYLKAYQRYQRVLQQRNAWLREASPGNRPGEGLAGFTEALVRYGAFISLRRLQAVERLAGRLDNTVHRIAPNQPSLQLIYLSNWVPEIECFSIQNKDLGPVNFAGHGLLPSLELLEQAFWKKISILEMAERKSGHSLVGPHRDDWAFFLGGQPLKGHGSQGEIRSALLALKLSEIELFRSETGHRPLFLLDDFSSELDIERRRFLLSFLSESDLQSFVTTTEPTLAIGKRFWVLNGNLDSNHDDSAEHADAPHEPHEQ